MSTPRIAVVGGYGVGMTMRTARVPSAGETVGDASFSAGPGGKGSNQAIAARRLGAEVALLTALGDDQFGSEARALWREEGVDAGRVVTAPGPTMAAFILVEPSGENRIVVAAGALAELRPEHVEAFRDELVAADVCLVSLEIPPEAAVAALTIAHEAGTTTVLNPAPARALPDRVWPTVDHLTPNLMEAAALTDSPSSTDPVELAIRLRALTSATPVLTLGNEGVVVGAGDEAVRVPAAPVKQVVDTTGAGDAFSAAFAVAVAEGRDVADAAAFGAAAGAWCVQHPEVIPGLPYRAELSDAAGSPAAQSHPDREERA